MTDFTSIVAESAPLETQINPLLPTSYDVVWSLVCFAVVIFAFWKYVLPKFQQVLEERRSKIEGGIEEADKLQAEAKELLDSYNAQLAEARTDAQAIRQEAREQGQELIEQMRLTAQKESDRIIENGRQQLNIQRKQLVAEMRSEVGRAAVELAEIIINEQLSDDARRSASIDQFLAEFDGADAPTGK